MTNDLQQRYLELVEQQASEQRQSKETEQLLCRTIIRLTLAASGLDPVLDPHLMRLREAVRKGVRPELKERIAALSEALIRASDEPLPEAEEADLFRRLLERVQLSGAGKRRLSSLSEAMLVRPAAVSGEQLDELLQLIAGGREKGGQGGFFNRLFGVSEADRGTSEADAEAPNQLLLHLLEKLSWPGQLSKDIVALQAQLGAQADAMAWADVIRDLAQLMAQALGDVQSEMRATEGFLKELTGRLEEIDRHVQSSQSDRQTSLERGNDLNQTVQDELGGIQERMRSATSLPQMRQAIGQHLDVIQAHVNSHVRAEVDRHHQAEAMERQLQARIHDIEQETRELRSKMRDAHLQAMTDAVTGMPNRMAYEERLRQEFARWKRFSNPLALLVWDVDDFKHINDRFGHLAGDKALRIIGTTLRGRLRETDFVGRYGGEEFVMLLSGAPLDDVLRLAEETRCAVRESGFHSGTKKVEVTISCGISDFRSGDTPEAVFKRADQALYAAKRNGKDCCVSG